MSEQTESVLLTERRGNILILTMNRPDAGNSINADLAGSLEAALNKAEEDPEVHCVILTGSGTKIFSGGMDLKYMALHGGEGVTFPGHGFAGITERTFSKPMICAVNGFAMGGGTEMALSCDLIIASENAKFGLPEVKRGIIAAAGGPLRIMRAVPKAIAMEILLTGDAVPAARALEVGLINRVVPAEQLMDEAIAMAERIICNAPLSVQATKQLAYQSYGIPLDEAFQLSNEISLRIFATEDAKEGPLAFAQKRAPVWKGR